MGAGTVGTGWFCHSVKSGRFVGGGKFESRLPPGRVTTPGDGIEYGDDTLLIDSTIFW